MTSSAGMKEQAAVQRIVSALPALIQNIRNEPELSWAHEVSLENLEVARVPPTFMNGDAFKSAARAVSQLVLTENDPTKRVHAGLIGTRLVVLEAVDESKVMLADLSFHDKKTGIIGFSTFDFDNAGTITKIYRSTTYQDGSFLTRKSGEYLQALLTGLLLKTADDTEPASGTRCEIIDGVKLYTHKKLLDVNSNYMDSQIQLAPRAMPRIRNELVREFKNYGAKFPPVQNDNQERAYFAEIGSQLESSEELWWVSEDMSKLVWDVAMSGTEPEDLSESELPSPAGIMWLNGGGGPVLAAKLLPDDEFLKTGMTPTELMSINAIIWYSPTVRVPGLELGKPRFMGLTASPKIARDTSQWNSIVSPMDVESNEVEYHRVPTYVTYHSLKFLPRKVALIAMRLAREESLSEKTAEPVGGSSSRKKQKVKSRQVATVTCSSLRKRRYLSDAEREAEAREFSHRWIVRGHMRNQPIGPRNAEGGQKHMRVWIAPYIKGPEDKPLVLKDRVQLFITSDKS